MTTTANIVPQTAAATDEVSIAAGAVGNFSLTGAEATDVIAIEKKTSTTTGTHDGLANAAFLTDSGESWEIDQWVGYALANTTDGSATTVTSNTATTITGVLAGGTDDDWDIGDTYTLINFLPFTFEDGAGNRTPAQLTRAINTRQVIGPMDIRINKPITDKAVGVDQYS